MKKNDEGCCLLEFIDDVYCFWLLRGQFTEKNCQTCRYRSPTGTWSGGSIPSPQAGLVLPVNQSPAVWAECWLFQGSFFREKLNHFSSDN